MNGIVAAQDVDNIAWLNETLFLMIGTSGGEFALSPVDTTQALGPSNYSVDRQSKLRCRQVRSELIGTANFYVQYSGKKVMAQDYTFFLNRYESTNQNRLANHIAGYGVTQGIIDIFYHPEPYETLWGLTNQGTLIGYVIDRQDNVTGWHEHIIAGGQGGPSAVESACVLPAPDGSRDELWMIVFRVINSVVVRTVEYMSKDFETGDIQPSCCYVDCAGYYNGAATTTITGLTWLIGETVQVYSDGYSQGLFFVNGSGTITLPTAASIVYVGLQCPAYLKTLRMEGGSDIGGTSQGKLKRANMATIRLKNSAGGTISNPNQLYQAPLALQTGVSGAVLTSAPQLINGDVARLPLGGDEESDCQFLITQSDPYPMEVVGLFPIFNTKEPSPGPT
jgi:hypothetical protein